MEERQLSEYAATAGENCRLFSGLVAGTDEVVAHAELKILPEHELGQVRRIAVAPHARRGGIGLALMRWMNQVAFDELGLNRLELVVFSFNEPARRTYERAGYKVEGRAQQARKASNGYWDLIYMALLESWHREESTPS